MNTIIPAQRAFADTINFEIPSLNSLSSARSLDRLNVVRRALAAHAGRPCVQEFEDRFRLTVAVAREG